LAAPGMATSGPKSPPMTSIAILITRPLSFFPPISGFARKYLLRPSLQ
jgi:hypothetical protein